MEDTHMLQEYGLNSNSAKAQSPATVGLAIRYVNKKLFFYKYNATILCVFFFRDDNGVFEQLELVSYSAPPDLPDVMKSQETNGQEQTN